MIFKMNNKTWRIIEVSQEEMRNYKKDNDPNTMYYGLTIIHDQEIWLYKDLIGEQKRQTLMHELAHAYIASYISLNTMTYDEDFLADIVGNSHDIIGKITDDYFKINEIETW